MWYPITSPRERGGRDLESSSSSLSSRRQCCPVDRRCTEQLRCRVQSRVSGMSVRGKQEGLWKLVLHMGLKWNCGQRGQKRASCWSLSVYTGCICLSVYTDCQHLRETSPRRDFVCSVAVFCFKFQHFYVQCLKSFTWYLYILALIKFLPEITSAVIYVLQCPRLNFDANCS